MRFRKKPVVIEAHQWSHRADSFFTAPSWLRAAHDLNSEALGSFFVPTGSKDAFIRTLEGRMRTSPGDWIIKGVKGELYPCKPDIFQQTYDPVGEE